MVSGVCVVLLCFFFKQKTAYEMRISDWSSDVCSSDLVPPSHLVVADRRLEDGRHFLFADDRAWHRLWLRTDRPGVPLANLILRDSLVGLTHEAAVISEARRVGKACVSTIRSRDSPYHYKQNCNPLPPTPHSPDT